MKADIIARKKLGTWGWGWCGGREEGEREGRRDGYGELGGMGWLRWRKDRYGSREEDILIKRVILGLARGLALEGFPGVHGHVPG